VSEGCPKIKNHTSVAVRSGGIVLKNSFDKSRAATFQRPSTSAGILLAFRTGEANQSVAKMLVPEFFNIG
jgi:hypothetical protein